MEADIYDQMKIAEQDHWWFVGRRRILETVITGLKLPARATILEAGCGTGGNLALLSQFGIVSAFEPDPNAMSFARDRRDHAATVRQGTLPRMIPFPHKSFDLVVAFDVLEHCADDLSAVIALKRMLAPGGRLLVTVPAFQFLWSEHDRRHQHHRRYTATMLLDTLDQAGFLNPQCSYFNTLLFPLVAGMRLSYKLVGGGDRDDQVPGAAVNKTLTVVFSAERHLLPRFKLPFGVSLLAFAG